MNETNRAFIAKHIDILSFRDLSEGTVRAYSSYLSQFLEWMEAESPECPIADITWEEVRAYIRYLKVVRALNPKSVNVHIAQLHDFFQYVLHRGWDRYEVPYLHVDEKLPAVPTRDEIETVINSLENPKHRAEFALLYSSGIRVSELCRLRCGDIHASKNYIYISRSKNRSDRYAILSERALGDLKAYIRSCYRHATREDWLFPGQHAGEHICTQSVRCTFGKQLASLGWDGRGFTLHSIRHAFGLHLYEAGTDIMSIKEAMGHKSLSSTAVYLSLGIGNGRSVKSPYDLGR